MKLYNRETQALGFAFTLACNIVDRGGDPRLYELPEVLHQWESRSSGIKENLTHMKSAPTDGEKFLGYLPYYETLAILYWDAYYAPGGVGGTPHTSGFIIDFSGEPVEQHGGASGWLALPQVKA